MRIGIHRMLVALAVAAMCAGSACGEDHPTTPDPGPTPRQTVPDEAEDETADEAECNRLLARYLRDREALARCAADEDCVEEWPGLCPHGPHYVGRGVDRTAFDALVARVMDVCTLPRCEAPAPLGPAACRDGRCTPR